MKLKKQSNTLLVFFVCVPKSVSETVIFISPNVLHLPKCLGNVIRNMIRWNHMYYANLVQYFPIRRLHAKWRGWVRACCIGRNSKHAVFLQQFTPACRSKEGSPQYCITIYLQAPTSSKTYWVMGNLQLTACNHNNCGFETK